MRRVRPFSSCIFGDISTVVRRAGRNFTFAAIFESYAPLGKVLFLLIIHRRQLLYQ
jgi:hypothetical protein